jgi:hypothetical protein
VNMTNSTRRWKTSLALGLAAGTLMPSADGTRANSLPPITNAPWPMPRPAMYPMSPGVNTPQGNAPMSLPPSVPFLPPGPYPTLRPALSADQFVRRCAPIVTPITTPLPTTATATATGDTPPATPTWVKAASVATAGLAIGGLSYALITGKIAPFTHCDFPRLGQEAVQKVRQLHNLIHLGPFPAQVQVQLRKPGHEFKGLSPTFRQIFPIVRHSFASVDQRGHRIFVEHAGDDLATRLITAHEVAHASFKEIYRRLSPEYDRALTLASQELRELMARFKLAKSQDHLLGYDKALRRKIELLRGADPTKQELARIERIIDQPEHSLNLLLPQGLLPFEETYCDLMAALVHNEKHVVDRMELEPRPQTWGLQRRHFVGDSPALPKNEAGQEVPHLITPHNLLDRSRKWLGRNFLEPSLSESQRGEGLKAYLQAVHEMEKETLSRLKPDDMLDALATPMMHNDFRSQQEWDTGFLEKLKAEFAKLPWHRPLDNP